MGQGAARRPHLLQHQAAGLQLVVQLPDLEPEGARGQSGVVAGRSAAIGNSATAPAGAAVYLALVPPMSATNT
jgi:hypothetical protein